MTEKQKEIIRLLKKYQKEGTARYREERSGNKLIPNWEMYDGKNFAAAFALNDKLYMRIRKTGWYRSKDLTRGYESFKSLAKEIDKNNKSYNYTLAFYERKY